MRRAKQRAMLFTSDIVPGAAEHLVEVAAQCLQANVDLGVVDVIEQPAESIEKRVVFTPTILIFEGDREVCRLAGLRSLKQLARILAPVPAASVSPFPLPHDLDEAA